MGRSTVDSRYKAATKHKKPKGKRKPPKNGKTTIRPARILGRPGIKIKTTF